MSTMSKQPMLRSKSLVAGFPDAIYDLSTLSSMAKLESRIHLGEEKHDHRVFRVKRKHVLKACDRCRVKKTKCDGKQPCNRCSSYNHPCLFRERKATQTKVYSRGFVEMLESHHSLVVKALQKIYKLCTTKEGFPGEPLAETSDGHPLTHAILDRLGLIQQAEDTPQASGEESEELQYLRVLSSSTDCTATADPSPEPVTPPDTAPGLSSPVQLSPVRQAHAPFKWDFQPLPQEAYHGYSQAELQSMTLPRPPPALSLETVNPTLASAPKCATTAPSPSIASLPNTYIYYADGACNPGHAGTDNCLQPVVTEGPPALPAATAARLPVGMVDNYNLAIPGQQGIYNAPLINPWAYPCE
ncbi:hypothetical protein BDV18DRAFT_76380 [Aspergillus unguis]